MSQLKRNKLKRVTDSTNVTYIAEQLELTVTRSWAAPATGAGMACTLQLPSPFKSYPPHLSSWDKLGRPLAIVHCGRACLSKVKVFSCCWLTLQVSQNNSQPDIAFCWHHCYEKVLENIAIQVNILILLQDWNDALYIICNVRILIVDEA